MPAPSYRRLLMDNPQFRRLWLGEVVSFLGDWFSTIALYTVVQSITDSAMAVAGVLIAKTLPMFVAVPFAGPIVDRYDRRTIMVATDLLRMVAVVGLIAAHHAESLFGIYAFLVLTVTFTAVFIPARSAAIPMLTDRSELPVAMALSGGTWSVMLALGAASGGVVTELIGIDGALVLDAATYAVSAVLLARLPPLPAAPDGSGGAGFLAGLSYLWRTPYVGAVGLLKSVMAFGGGALAMLPLYGNGLLGAAGPLWIGLLYTGRGLGALFGSLGVRSVVGDEPATLRRSLLPGLLLIAVGYVAVAMAPGVWTASVGYCIAAIGSAVIWVFSGTLIQFAVEPSYRGRVFSVEFGMMTLVMSVVSAIAGFLVDRGVAPDHVMLGSAMAVVCVGVLATGLVHATAPDDG